VFTDYFTNEVVFSFGDLVFYKYFWEDDYMLSEGLKILETKGGSDLFNDSEFKEIVKKSNNNLEFLRINLEEAIEQKKNSFTYKVFTFFHLNKICSMAQFDSALGYGGRLTFRIVLGWCVRFFFYG